MNQVQNNELYDQEEIVSSRIKSENYYMYENVDEKSNKGKRSQKDIEEKIRNGEFQLLKSKSSFDIDNINRHCNSFILGLDQLRIEIKNYKSPRVINDLF